MFVLRIGALTVILSDMLVKGFTTGAAVHVLMSQVKSLFGLTLPRYSGPGKLIKVGPLPVRKLATAVRAPVSVINASHPTCPAPPPRSYPGEVRRSVMTV